MEKIVSGVIFILIASLVGGSTGNKYSGITGSCGSTGEHWELCECLELVGALTARNHELPSSFTTFNYE